jgi:hypothetical protein
MIMENKNTSNQPASQEAQKSAIPQGGSEPRSTPSKLDEKSNVGSSTPSKTDADAGSQKLDTAKKV